MNPIMQMLQQSGAPVQPAKVTQQNIMQMALAAAMSGQTPQQFLSTLPQFAGMDLSNIQGMAQSLCRSKGIDYNAAMKQVSDSVNTKR